MTDLGLAAVAVSRVAKRQTSTMMQAVTMADLWDIVVLQYAIYPILQSVILFVDSLVEGLWCFGVCGWSGRVRTVDEQRCNPAHSVKPIGFTHPRSCSDINFTDLLHLAFRRK